VRRPRWLHRLYARVFGYFWLPCPLCLKPFGGHEWGDRNGLPAQALIDGELVGICPDCTLAGRGYLTRFRPPGGPNA